MVIFHSYVKLPEGIRVPPFTESSMYNGLLSNGESFPGLPRFQTHTLGSPYWILLVPLIRYPTISQFFPIARSHDITNGMDY